MRRNTSSASGGISAASASASRPDRNTVSYRSRSVAPPAAPATSIGGSRSVNVGLTVRVRVPPTGTGTPSTTTRRRSVCGRRARSRRRRIAGAPPPCRNNPPRATTSSSHSRRRRRHHVQHPTDDDGTSRVGLVGRGGVGLGIRVLESGMGRVGSEATARAATGANSTLDARRDARVVSPRSVGARTVHLEPAVRDRLVVVADEVSRDCPHARAFESVSPSASARASVTTSDARAPDPSRRAPAQPRRRWRTPRGRGATWASPWTLQTASARRAARWRRVLDAGAAASISASDEWGVCPRRAQLFGRGRRARASQPRETPARAPPPPSAARKLRRASNARRSHAPREAHRASRRTPGGGRAPRPAWWCSVRRRRVATSQWARSHRDAKLAMSDRRSARLYSHARACRPGVRQRSSRTARSRESCLTRRLARRCPTSDRRLRHHALKVPDAPGSAATSRSRRARRRTSSAKTAEPFCFSAVFVAFAVRVLRAPLGALANEFQFAQDVCDDASFTHALPHVVYPRFSNAVGAHPRGDVVGGRVSRDDARLAPVEREELTNRDPPRGAHAWDSRRIWWCTASCRSPETPPGVFGLDERGDVLRRRNAPEHASQLHRSHATHLRSARTSEPRGTTPTTLLRAGFVAPAPKRTNPRGAKFLLAPKTRAVGHPQIAE